MTNEEAIMILKAMIDDMILVFDRDRKKALNMAIEALKEQPERSQNTSSKQAVLETLGVKTCETCEDVISRRAAIDVLDVLCQEHRYRIPGKRETYSQYNEAWQDALDRAEGAIFNLPSVQPEPRWISCNDRLPDKDGDYLVYYDEGYREDYGFDEIGIAPFEVDCEGFGIWQEKFDHWTLGSLGSDWVEIKVVAWMPLPEPYQAERREEWRKSDVKST